MIYEIWRLSENEDDDNLGLVCTERGLVLGGTPLIERRYDGFVVRDQREIERLLGRAYGMEVAADRLMPGLTTVAAALNANDQGLARIAAVHLRIPDLPDQSARSAVAAEDRLIKSIDWNPDLHPRTGTSPNSGWFATTDGSADVRTAQNENPAQRSDASWGNSKPGDRFATPDDAAISALVAVYAITRSTNLEYAGRIYKNADGSFSYTQGLSYSQRDPSIPNRNCCSDFSTPGDVPAGTDDVGSYHTHTDIPSGNSAEFSGADFVFYTYRDKLPGYVVGTTDQGVGQILKFTPGETINQGITQLLGSISDGAFVPNSTYDPDLKASPSRPGGDSYDPDRDDSK